MFTDCAVQPLTHAWGLATGILGAYNLVIFLKFIIYNEGSQKKIWCKHFFYPPQKYFVHIFLACIILHYLLHVHE